MKKRLSGFFAGVLCATIVFSLSLSALAISGKMTIEVDPINIMVNGEVFVPTDVNGKEVPQFAYQGTTYAPLRALAEAYGLQVGYDAEKNMATVSDPEAKPVVTPAPDTTAKNDYSDWSAEDEAAYQEFKEKWELTYSGELRDGSWVYTFVTEDEEAYTSIANRNRLKDPVILKIMEETNKHPNCNFMVNFDGPNNGITVSMVDGELC